MIISVHYKLPWYCKHTEQDGYNTLTMDTIKTNFFFGVSPDFLELYAAAADFQNSSSLSPSLPP